MTTREPGAMVVFTHGLVIRPFSTALRARRAAPSITDGLEVLVQLVMAAMTTWPWSMSNVLPSANVTGTRLDGRTGLSGSGGWAAGASLGTVSFSSWPAAAATGSLAGKESADAWSRLPSMSWAPGGGGGA